MTTIAAPHTRLSLPLISKGLEPTTPIPAYIDIALGLDPAPVVTMPSVGVRIVTQLLSTCSYLQVEVVLRYFLLLLVQGVQDPLDFLVDPVDILLSLLDDALELHFGAPDVIATGFGDVRTVLGLADNLRAGFELG